MTTAIATFPGDIAQFKVDIDTLLAKRKYFSERILPTLVEGQDYYVIKGKKSLGKAGAEKLAGIYNLVATFERDEATISSFSQTEGLIAYVCTLHRPDRSISGQGRGSSVITAHNGDVNKTIKMAQKSAFIDGVIRATGLSGTFTQDLDLMPAESIQAPKEDTGCPNIELGRAYPAESTQDPDAMTEKQRNFLISLIAERISGKDQTEEWLAQLDSGLSKSDASELISSLIPVR